LKETEVEHDNVASGNFFCPAQYREEMVGQLPRRRRRRSAPSKQRACAALLPESRVAYLEL
jgi:hypothetical protein